MAAAAPVRVGRTRSRSLLAHLNDFASTARYWAEVSDSKNLESLEDRLADMPCKVSGRHEDVVWPQRTAVRLLEERWG